MFIRKKILFSTKIKKKFFIPFLLLKIHLIEHNVYGCGIKSNGLQLTFYYFYKKMFGETLLIRNFRFSPPTKQQQKKLTNNKQLFNIFKISSKNLIKKLKKKRFIKTKKTLFMNI